MVFVSSTEHGNMHPNLDVDGSSAQDNFDAFCAQNGVDPSGLVGIRIDPKWEDGARVATEVGSHVVPGSVNPRERQEAHALIAPRDQGVFVLSGDCYPFVITADGHHAVGHIGWRSVDEGLMEKVIGELKSMGYSPESLLLHLGPGISAVSNVVRADEALQLSGPNASRWEGYTHQVADAVQLDMQNAIIDAARNSGIKPVNTTIDGRDTYMDPDLYSRRATVRGETGKPRGNHAFIVPPA